MAYNPANPSGTDPSQSPYDALRNKAKQDAGNSEAQGMDAITRRYAAMGNLNSGSYVKAQEDVHRTAQGQAQDQLANIGVAEQGQALPYAQLQQQKEQFGQTLGEQQSEFARSEQDKGRSLDLEATQQGLDSAANGINASMAAWQQAHSGGLLGGGGFLGLGL